MSLEGLSQDGGAGTEDPVDPEGGLAILGTAALSEHPEGRRARQRRSKLFALVDQ